MGLVDALIGLKGKREEWRLEAPMREAMLEKAKAEAAASKSQTDMMNKMAKIWDGFNKENPNFISDVQNAEKEATQPQQQQKPQGLTDMMTQFAPSFGGGAPGQPAQAAPQPQQPQGQPGGNGGFEAALTNPAFLTMAKTAGIDLTSIGSLQERMNRNKQLSQEAAARLGEQKRGNDIREVGTALDIKRYNRESTAYNIVEKTNEQGETEKVLIPKYTGQKEGGLSFGSSIKTSPSLKSMPIAEQNIPLWRHKKNLDSPPMGITPKEAEAKGYKRLSTAQVDAVQNFGQVENILATIEGLMEKVFPKEESALGRMIGAPKRKLSAIAQTDPDAAMLMRLINGTLAPIVRSMGEKGNLSDTDIKRAAKLFPDLMDRGPVAWGMLTELKGIIERNKQTKLGGMGLEVPKADVKQKQIVRTGKDKQGKKVVQYDDGTIEYAK